MTSYIPEDEFSQDKGPVEIVTLADIEVEYALVLAQLQLSTRVEGLHEYGESGHPI